LPRSDSSTDALFYPPQRLLLTQAPWPSSSVDLGHDAACFSRRQMERQEPEDYRQSGPLPGDCTRILLSTEVSDTCLHTYYIRSVGQAVSRFYRRQKFIIVRYTAVTAVAMNNNIVTI
jgi:hypothetical protein